jgi:hypothetical protein
MRKSGFSRLAVLAGALALFAGPMACGSILGIGDPTVVEDSGTGTGMGDSGMDATSSGGNGDVTVKDAPIETTSEASSDGTVSTDGEAGPEDAAEDSDAVATDAPEGDGGCQAGFVVCTPEGGAAGSGACTNLSSDPKNCSNCGSACPVNNNTPVCHLGGCQLGTCDTNFADCNTNATDGCEINLFTDPLNCGVCGMVCPSGQFCVGGTCGTTCTSATPTICEQLPDGGAAAYVDGSTLPLYCANLQQGDTSNCGSCGKKCPVNNNSPVCTGGACTTGTCDTGYADCNNDPKDGCEVNLNTDPTHCGSCNIPCTATSATTECLTGQCAIFACNAGTADCDHLYSTGCEVNTTTDKLNCGACNNSCNTTCTGNIGSVTCTSSNCQVATCGPGYFDIDGLCADGCECQQTTVGTCAAPRTVSLTGPGSTANVTGNLVPTGKEDWFTVTFTLPKATNYHPHVVFMTNPGGEYVFDVESNCSGGNLACTEKNDAGVALHSTGLTAWETFYSAGVDFVDASFVQIPSVGTILVHVYRATGAPVDCLAYTLTISN